MSALGALVVLGLQAAPGAAPGAAPAPSRPTDDFGRALALAAQVARTPCKSDQGQNLQMSEATLLCDAFVTGALVSLALDAPERTAKAIEAIDPLLDAALSDVATKAFSSSHVSTIAGRKVPQSVLYQGLVLWMLAGRERLGPGSKWTPLFDALATAQLDDLDTAAWLPSFGRDQRWPCDHAPASTSLALHGALRGSARSRAGAVALAGKLDQLRSRPKGFPTRVDGVGKAVEEQPRGTAMAWTAAFLWHGQPQTAEAFARDFTARFCERPLGAEVGLGVCREWPRGVNGKPDSVSGPIVQGYGVGATALGLGATHALTGPGSDWFAALDKTAQTGGLGDIVGNPEKAPLQASLALWARSTRSWLPTQSAPEGAPPPDAGPTGRPSAPAAP